MPEGDGRHTERTWPVHSAWAAESERTQSRPHRRALQFDDATGINAPEAITQEMLSRYKELDDIYAKLKRERDQIRVLILELDESGAAVEPGGLTITVQKQRQRRLNGANLTPILGEEAVERLKEQVEPTIHRTLRVLPTGA